MKDQNENFLFINILYSFIQYTFGGRVAKMDATLTKLISQRLYRYLK